ncbi:hypothetical protein EYF80_042645 [Liparis tanakae]|uniref:Uncharacterized protein n=1 Tax=Liparis tanakae TaxID=230148 RepID=A0A4Z2G1J2_9TELE|nr:hypothetical protein EYF80_042645 [Liparis tanakae]
MNDLKTDDACCTGSRHNRSESCGGDQTRAAAALASDSAAETPQHVQADAHSLHEVSDTLLTPSVSNF